MCTVVILVRPGHPWPLLLAANRDEMADRPALPPGRHWPDRPKVVAGIDRLAGGTWLGINDVGVVAGVLNRRHSLGPEPGLRSRGELPLEALDHAEAEAAAEALAQIETASYRSFNLFVADRRHAFWLKSNKGENGAGNGTVEVRPLPPGLSMITAHDLDDPASARIRFHRPRFERAAPPDPGTGDWSPWQALLASREAEAGAGSEGAMTIVTGSGFGTVSSSLIALPADDGFGVKPVWRFAAGRPDQVPFEPVALES